MAAFTASTLTVLDGNNNLKTISGFTDGTNFLYGHGNVDSLGNLLTTEPIIVTGSSFTRPANTTTYAFGQLVANSTAAGSVVPGTIAAARGVNVVSSIQRIRLTKSGVVSGTGAGSITNAIFRIHLYNVLPTPTNGDGAAWLTTLNGYVGSYDVTVDKLGSDVSFGAGVGTVGYAASFAPVSGTANLYYLIEARAAYVPASGETFTVTAEVQ